jgi:hypothetical protein
MGKRRWWLLLAVGFVVWHVVFDLQVEDAATRYVAQQELAAQGIGQPVPIDEVMRPALTLSARVASAWSVLAVALAYVLTCSARRPHPGPGRTS